MKRFLIILILLCVAFNAAAWRIGTNVRGYPVQYDTRIESATGDALAINAPVIVDGSMAAPTIQCGTYLFSTGNATLKGDSPYGVLLNGNLKLFGNGGSLDAGDAIFRSSLQVAGDFWVEDSYNHFYVLPSRGELHLWGLKNFTRANVWKNYGTSQSIAGTDGLFKSVTSSSGWVDPGNAIDGNNATVAWVWSEGEWSTYLTVSPGSTIAQPEWISGIKVRGYDDNAADITAQIDIQTVDSGTNWVTVFDGLVPANVLTTVPFPKREYVKYTRIRIASSGADVAYVCRFDPIRHPNYYPVPAMSNASTIGVPIEARQFIAYGTKTGGTVTYMSEGFPAFKGGTTPIISLTAVAPSDGAAYVPHIVTSTNTGFTYRVMVVDVNSVVQWDDTEVVPVHWQAMGWITE